jgi:hypothetical protein
MLDGDVVAWNIRRLTGHVPADLLDLLLLAGFWTPEHALAHAMRPDHLRDRSKVLYHRLPDPMPTDPAGIAAAEDAPVTQLQRDRVQAAAIADLAPVLPAHLIGEALAGAAAIGNEAFRASALRSLLPFLPGDLLGVVVTAAAAFTDQCALATTLAAALPQIPPGQRPALQADAIAAVAAIRWPEHRIRVSADLARHLPAAQRTIVLQDALAAVAGLTPDEQPLFTGVLAAHLSPALLDTAVAMAAGLPAKRRLQSWAALLPHLDGEQRAAVVREAMHTIDGMDSVDGRTEAVADLAAYLPADTLVDAARVATSVTDPEDRAWWLIKMVPHLPEPLHTPTAVEALDAAAEIPHEAWRLRALWQHAHDGPATHLDRVLTEMLAIDRQEWRAQGLVWLAHYLPPELRSKALTATDAISDPYRRAEAWAALAAHQILTTQRT